MGEELKTAVYILFGCKILLGTLVSLTAFGSFSAVAEANRRMTESTLDFQSIYRLKDLSDSKIELFSVPNKWHAKGAMHSAMYRATVNGQKTLIKVIFPGSHNFGTENSFRTEVSAMLLASDIGGPQVYRAGKIVDEHGLVGYFIQMEEIFAGERGTFTLKGWGGRSRLSRIFSLRSLSSNQLKKIGTMISLALERRIGIGIDHDFIFSPQGDDVRWIDTAQWILPKVDSFGGPNVELRDSSSSDFNTEVALNCYAYLIAQFFRMKENYGALLLQSLQSDIRNSEVWNDYQKINLIKSLRTNLVANWKIHPDLFGKFDENLKHSSSTVKSCAGFFKEI